MLKFFPQKATPAPARPAPVTPASVPEHIDEPEAVQSEAEYIAEPEADTAFDAAADLSPAETMVDEAPAATAFATHAPAAVSSSKSAYTFEKPKAPEKTPAMPDKNILSKDVEIKGNIKFTNELVIDGKIEGEISSDGVLTVGENADIRGEIKTKSVTVLGKVNGNITVGERCELKARAHLVGDLKAGRLVIEEGATFVGKSEVTTGNKNSTVKTPAAGDGLNAGR